MAIYFSTNDPTALLAAFKKAIDTNHVETWSYDKDGDFTHTPEQWKNKAWLRPVVSPGRLALHFLARKDELTSKVVYGVYHGRFIESMLTHFDNRFSTAEATADAAAGDIVTTRVA